MTSLPVLKGIETVLPSADSFIAVVCESTELRDQNMETLRNAPFTLDGSVVVPIVTPFGGHGSHRANVWSVTTKYGDKPKMILQALKDHFANSCDIPFSCSVEVAPILFCGNPAGACAIHFELPPPWRDKKLHIGDSFRMLSTESNVKCRWCNKAGHAIWECESGGHNLVGKERAVRGGDLKEHLTIYIPSSTSSP